MTHPNISKSGLQSAFTYDPVKGGLSWRLSGGSRKLNQRAGGLTELGYRRIGFKGRIYFEHRLVWMWHHDCVPCLIDHINNIPSDNRIENLREATSRQNQLNRSSLPRNKCGHPGLTFRATQNKWRFSFQVGGFKTKAGAITGYKLARKFIMENFGYEK